MAVRTAAEAAPSRPNRARPGFRPDVQGLRAIAVGVVVLYHLRASVLPGGFVGVDVFFVISGYLITGGLARTATRRAGRVSLLDFYGRRARRLMPAAVLVLVVTWLVSLRVLPTTRLPDAATQVRASALYFQNWTLAHDAVSYLTSDNAASPVQHFWSLSVEEQFYLGWPLLFLLAAGAAYLVVRSRDGGARAALAGRLMLGLALAVLAVSLWYSVHETRANPAAAYFVTTTRMWELAAGGALALLPGALAARLGRFGVLSWVGLGMVVASCFVISGSSPFPGSLALLPVGGAVLLIACGSPAGRFGTAGLTSLRPMVFFGDISYSLYLWHWPVIVLWEARSRHPVTAGDAPFIVALSVLLAWLTKVFVEDRVRLSPTLAGHRWRSIATVVVVAVPVSMVSVWLARQPTPIVGQVDRDHPGAAVLAGTARNVPHVAAIPSLIKASGDFGAYGRGPGGCQTQQYASAETVCRFGDTTNPTRTVAIVGDSVAAEWFGVLEQLAVEQHWELVTDLHSLCPWTATMAHQPGGSGPYTSCHTWGRAVLADLLTRIRPDLVLTSARPTVGAADHPTADQTSFAELGAGMATYWRQLIAHGIAVVAMRETPEMGKDIPDCLSQQGSSTKGCSTPTRKAIVPNTPIVVAARAVPQATLIDMNRYICGPLTCEPIVGNIVVYIDQHHITDVYAMSMAPYLDAQLLRLPALRAVSG